MNVHPFADRFPMLSPDDLTALAEDIKQHGQIHPIVIWEKTGELLDGRNRLAACEQIGIEPKMVMWNGDYPEAFIVSVNVHRRHIPKGTQAMAVALVYPEPEKGGRGKKRLQKKREGNTNVFSKNINEELTQTGTTDRPKPCTEYTVSTDRPSGPDSESTAKDQSGCGPETVNPIDIDAAGQSHSEKQNSQMNLRVLSSGHESNLLSNARIVIREFGADSAIVKEVMAGGSLNDAYIRAQERIHVRERRAQQLQDLTNEFPDLAKNVTDGIWTIERAIAYAEAERQYKANEKEIKDLTDQLQLHIEEIESWTILSGPEADLSTSVEDVEKIIPISREQGTIEDLKAQNDFVRKLILVEDHLRKMHDSIPQAKTDDTAGWVVATRSGLNTIIKLCHLIGNEVNRLSKEKDQIRRIK